MLTAPLTALDKKQAQEVVDSCLVTLPGRVEDFTQSLGLLRRAVTRAAGRVVGGFAESSPSAAGDGEIDQHARRALEALLAISGVALTVKASLGRHAWSIHVLELDGVFVGKIREASKELVAAQDVVDAVLKSLQRTPEFKDAAYRAGQFAEILDRCLADFRTVVDHFAGRFKV